jgi:guanylate kinase
MLIRTNPGHKGFLLILSSPSGGGKTTIFREIIRRHPEIKYSISATTRSKRNGETDGVDYFFLTKRDFLKKAEAGKFAEWADVHDNLYGTPKEYIDRVLADGRCIMLDIDIQGGNTLKKLYSRDGVLVFILPPSIGELERRLRSRKTDNEEVIHTRLRNAMDEITHAQEYDYLVINEKLTQAVKEVECIICAEGRRMYRTACELDSFKNLQNQHPGDRHEIH